MVHGGQMLPTHLWFWCHRQLDQIYQMEISTQIRNAVDLDRDLRDDEEEFECSEPVGDGPGIESQ